MANFEQWFDYDDERTPRFLPGPFESFLGATSVAEDISTVIGAATQGASNVITSYGDAKAGGGLSRAVGDTGLKIGIGVACAIAAYVIFKRR